MALQSEYKFRVHGADNTTITLFADWEDFAAANASPANEEAKKQLIRKRLMKRVHTGGGEGARLIPIT